MPKKGPFDWITRTACSSHGEYLDTDRLLNLGYGNLVLRNKTHIYLGQGVIFALACLALIWVISANWDIIASGRGLSGMKALPVLLTLPPLHLLHLNNKCNHPFLL